MGRIWTGRQLIILMTLVIGANLWGGTRDQARFIYASLTGTAANKSQLDELEAKIKAGEEYNAIKDIVNTHPDFYNVTLKDFATPWSNVDKSTQAPLNDMTATIIGHIRDDRPFHRILWDNIVYQANDTIMYTTKSGKKMTNLVTLDFYRYMVEEKKHPRFVADNKNQSFSSLSCKNRGPICQMAQTNDNLYYEFADIFIPTFLKNNNNQYEAMSLYDVNLGDSRSIIAKSQNPSLFNITVDPLQETITSGVFSTRTFASAFLSAGTNRRAIAFILDNFLCSPLEQLNDVTTPDFRVRRDIDRNPGGDSRQYKNFCVGCHAGMDALGGAFAYYDYKDGAINYSMGSVVSKMNHNSLFAEGFITQSDSWMNLWVKGQNAKFFTLATTGENMSVDQRYTLNNGLKNLGRMFASTKQFPICMSQKVFKKVCFRDPVSQGDLDVVQANATEFINRNYNMKDLFIMTALSCMGE